MRGAPQLGLSDLWSAEPGPQPPKQSESARRQDTTVSGFTTIRALVQRTRGLRRPLRERAGPSLQGAEEHSVHYHLFKATNSWKGSRKPKQNWPNFVR